MTSSQSNMLQEREREIGNAALNTLVNQFSNSFHFIRELVQNSLDSGTPVVEVWSSFVPIDDNRGIIQIHVRDYGTGMDEKIIDSKLTKLFSSSKEDDLTSIGKFGIGFVSVFAIEPDGVIVKTSRGGEHWEIFFNRDRSFEKTKLSDPLEGTHITIFKELSVPLYKYYSNKIKETLEFWCKHAEKDIVFWDANENDHKRTSHGKRKRHRTPKNRINRPLDLQGYYLPVSVKCSGTEVVAAFSWERFCGFYNQGLTLVESNDQELITGYEPFLDHIAFKVKSPYLEHTLTRDTIRRDANFHKAMLIAVDAVRIDLVQALVNRLEQLAEKQTLNTEETKEYLVALEWLYDLPRSLDPTFSFTAEVFDASTQIPVISRLWRDRHGLSEKSIDGKNRKIFRTCFGGAYTLAELSHAIEKTDNTVLLADEESERTRELVENEFPVFLSPLGSSSKKFFLKHLRISLDGTLQKNKVIAYNDWRGGKSYPYKSLEFEKLPRGQQNYLLQLEKALNRVSFPFGRLFPTNFLGDDPTSQLAGIIKYNDRVATMPQIRPYQTRVDLAINVEGTHFKRLTQLYQQDNTLGLMLGARRTILETVLDEEIREELFSALWENF